MTRLRRDDSGGSLVVVLIIVAVGSLVGGALLSLAGTGIHNTVGLREHAESRYAADGAIQAAVNNLRNSQYTGATGQDCLGAGDTLQLPQFYGTDSAAVSCVTDPAQVMIHCPSLSNCNRPGSAILTLGQVSGEDGINIKQPTNSSFNVHGGVFSNSNINVVNGTLNTNSRLHARGACTGSIVSTPTKQCNYGATANPFGNDPGYQPAAATVPVYRSLPPCTTRNSVVTFLPGYYDDAAGLTAMMDGNSACRHSTWWFKPGVYYFDFHNSGTNRNPLLPNTANVWNIDDGYLVAGTPVNAAGAAIAAPANPASIPGACDNPIRNAGAVGVQFIFGGESRLAIKSGQAEICGTYSINKPPVAIYGLQPGTGGETDSVFAGLAATSVPTPGGFGATATTANLATANGTAATFTGQGNGSGGQTTLSVSGFASPEAIPAGSILKSARLSITHRHTSATQKKLDLTVTPVDGGTAQTMSTPLRTGGTNAPFQTDMFTLNVGAGWPLSQAVYAGTYSGVKVDVLANMGNNVTAAIDAIQLELTYVKPAMRGGSGCITAGPYNGSGSACALMTSINNNGNEFYVQGTTYAPAAVIDLTLNNAAEQVFRFGVAVRSLWVTITGSFSFSGPVIEVPDDSPGYGFSLYLTAYVCPDSTTCAATGTPVTRARIALVDGDPVSPTPGRRQVVVLSWNSG
jgi:hypothetical protein